MTAASALPDDRVLEAGTDWADPERVHRELFSDAAASVWLDSGPDAREGMSIMGAPSRVVTVEDPRMALAELAELLASAPRLASRPDPVPLGWVGWVGYEAGAAELRTPVHRADSPAMAMGYLDRALVFDHAAHRIRLLALDEGDAAGWLEETGERMRTIAAAPTDEAGDESGAGAAGEVRWRHDREQYLALIREAQRLIADGDAYQICLCNEGVVEGSFDPVAVYRGLRSRAPTHHGGLFRFGDHSLLSGSPEQFLTVDRGGRVMTRPMKGTRPRGADPASDEALARELHDSDKERAENVMIVDLMRNDLSRVSKLGSVEVTELFGVERYATVHQLVSTVESSLTTPGSVAELLQATLPPGSMTGAPKHSAMDAIDRLEDGPRGIFSGVCGRISIDGTADLAVVIRSIALSPTAASLGAGGGITALSSPEDEYAETMLKAETMLGALGVGGRSTG